ncbi:hypothetical protein, partial [Lysinibacillus agricola]|uniref:hypothetical protein n=1 Tax=Lysinibacillus agricola TaxID=2590012 RepID=UPI003C1A5B0A
GFYLRESEAAAAKGFYLRESEAAAADVFCAKAQCQRSDSNNNTKLNKECTKVKQIKIIKIKNFSCFCIFYIIQFSLRLKIIINYGE